MPKTRLYRLILIALLDSRLESLSPAAKHVLQACVAFEADCCPATIAALTGLDGYELLLILEGLVEDGVVIDSGAGISCRSSLLAERVRIDDSGSGMLVSRRASALPPRRRRHSAVFAGNNLENSGPLARSRRSSRRLSSGAAHAGATC